VRQAREDRLVNVVVANTASYFPRPRLRSQTTTSMMARPSGLPHFIVPSGGSVQERLR
jgi:hypothetical protein